MLVFSAIVPHPPILLPKLQNENAKKITKTSEALEKLRANLEVANPDAIIIFSPHGKNLADAFSMNLVPSYKADFEEFGDFETKREYKSDIMLIQEIQESVRYVKKMPLAMTSDEKLDHGITIPLELLVNPKGIPSENLKNTAIIPIYPSMLDYKTHFSFGGHLKDVIVNHGKKIALIASGDLSHGLTSDAPAGFSPRGKEFDKKIIELISTKNAVGTLNLDEGFVNEAKECGFHCILMLLGLMEKINYTPEILSYEGPLGVGYMVANFKF